jgi:hypothetical protein
VMVRTQCIHLQLWRLLKFAAESRLLSVAVN